MSAGYERISLYPDVQVQNGPSTRVYVFGDADVTQGELNVDDPDAVELSKIRSRGRKDGGDYGAMSSFKMDKNSQQNNECFEKEICDGDSLQSIALQFRCPVAELKRVNNLISDQEFFALRVIKVPLKSHGYLKELVEKQKEEDEKQQRKKRSRERDDAIFKAANIYSEDEDTLYAQDIDAAESDALLVRTISIRKAMDQSKEAEEFLKDMDEDLERIRASTKVRMDSLEQVTESLTCKRIYPLEQTKKRTFLSGTDCGLRWWSVLAIMFAIGLLLPIAYAVYYVKFCPKDTNEPVLLCPSP